MAEFHLEESFDIDDPSFDSVPPRQAFVYGVEWMKVMVAIRNYWNIHETVHLDNAERLKALCLRHGYDVDLTAFADDKNESWARLHATRRLG